MNTTAYVAGLIAPNPHLRGPREDISEHTEEIAEQEQDMTITTEQQTAATEELDHSRTEALAERLFGSFTFATELLTVELGRRLGLYDVLTGAGPLDVTQFAHRTGLHERYAREWLDQQAAAGFLDVEVDRIDGHRSFVLPAAHVPVLVHEEHPAHLVGAAPLLLGVAQSVAAVAEAYATGTGVEYADFGPDLRFGIGSLNRPGFANFTRDWVEELPDIAARLDSGGTVLDAGCGVGWSSIGLAVAFPRATVVGVDLDEASIVEARRHAEDAGVGDRVRFVQANASDGEALAAELPGGADLVTVFQALHDMGDPVGALVAFRKVLAPGGAVLVGDEHGEEHPAAPADEVERLKLAMSVLHCVPATWAESDAVVNGTVLRPHTLRAWVGDAGYAEHRTLPIEHPFWRFHRLS